MNPKLDYVELNGRRIGSGHPVYLIAEMSANHNGDFETAVELIRVAKEAGADAVKAQTYRSDTLTIDCRTAPFLIKDGLWKGRTLYDLYEEAAMPWKWQPDLKTVADEVGIDFFSTPFDATAVDFLEEMGVPAIKVASFECVDIPLLRRVGGTGLPVILSTGMATRDEIEEAVDVLRESGTGSIALLKCTSAYPASPVEMNLGAIPIMEKDFGLPVGLSDHSMGSAVAVSAVALGACIVEKHFTLSRSDSGVDAAFSMEPAEFKEMVGNIRTAEEAVGTKAYSCGSEEIRERRFRRSVYVVEDVDAGESITEKNTRCIRPAGGLHPRYYAQVLGRVAKTRIVRGTPLSMELLD